MASSLRLDKGQHRRSGPGNVSRHDGVIAVLRELQATVLFVSLAITDSTVPCLTFF